MSDIELPDLPEPELGEGSHIYVDGYTAEQMRAYAIADREKRAQAAQEVDNTKMWAVHVDGPDDVHAVPDREIADAACVALNCSFKRAGLADMCRAEVIEWPHGYESWSAQKDQFRLEATAPTEASKPVQAEAPSSALIEAVDTLLDTAPCDCSDKRRFEKGEHLSHCYLFDLNVSRLATKQAEAPTLEESCESLYEAGHDFFKARRRDGLQGSVCWVEYDDGTVVIFTRGEYKGALIKNIDEISEPKSHVFTDPGAPDADKARALTFATKQAEAPTASNTQAHAIELYDALVDALKAIIECDDEAKSAHGYPDANLNGYGLVDLFDCVGHHFGAGPHKQQPYRSNSLNAALHDARAALATQQEAQPQAEPARGDKEDAERYRVIRDWGATFMDDQEKSHHVCEQAMDAVIDAARAAQQATGERG